MTHTPCFIITHAKLAPTKIMIYNYHDEIEFISISSGPGSGTGPFPLGLRPSSFGLFPLGGRALWAEGDFAPSFDVV